jgi:hypothetical protein
MGSTFGRQTLTVIHETKSQFRADSNELVDWLRSRTEVISGPASQSPIAKAVFGAFPEGVLRSEDERFLDLALGVL